MSLWFLSKLFLPDLCHWSDTGRLQVKDVTLVPLKAVFTVAPQLHLRRLSCLAEDDQRHFGVCAGPLHVASHDDYFVLCKGRSV